MKDVSQYWEATKLIEYFKENPPKYRYLVDVGASRIELSNTYNLILVGWTGLLIEPMPTLDTLDLWEKVSIFGIHRRNLLFGFAIADFNGESSWHVKEPIGHSSLIHGPDDIILGSYSIPVKTLPDVLDKYSCPKDFDLLSVDTEGMDYRILKYMIDRSDYRPKVILHESSKPDDFSFLRVAGYRPLFQTKGNEAWEYVRTN